MGKVGRIALLVLVAVLSQAVVAQREAPFRAACWNVENLFDTIAHPPLLDGDFTPSGSYGWHSGRYWRKQGQIARTIIDMSGVAPLFLVGLVEVENDSVIYDLTHRTSLAALGYASVVSHSEDVRGINVALLYQPVQFALISHDSLRIAPPPGHRPTRDILHAAGRLTSGDTLDVFIVHLPSRRGGTTAARYRMQVAEALAHCADSLRLARRTPRLLIMGDFNSEANDPIFRRALSEYSLLSRSLSGTYFFQGNWSQIDHVLVNPEWEASVPMSTTNFSAPYLTRSTEAGDTPFRTYLGPYYQGGVSDHLPVLFSVSSNETSSYRGGSYDRQAPWGAY